MPIQNVNFLTSNLHRPAAEDPGQLARMVFARAKAMRMEFLRELGWQLRCWYQRRVASGQMHALDDAALKDIGLHRSGIEAALDGAAPQNRRAFAEKPHLCLQRTG